MKKTDTISKETKHTQGTITQIIGVVVDVQFPEGKVPSLYEALHVASPFVGSGNLVLEVASHLGDDRVKAVALGPTDGLKRGDSVMATGAPISVPVGKKTLGRIFNVVGEVIDGKAQLGTTKQYPIHRAAPQFVDQSSKQEI